MCRIGGIDSRVGEHKIRPYTMIIGDRSLCCAYGWWTHPTQNSILGRAVALPRPLPAESVPKKLYTFQKNRNAENRIQKSENSTLVRARGHNHSKPEVAAEE